MSTSTAHRGRHAAGPGDAVPAPLSPGRACGVVAASAVAPGSGHVMLGRRAVGWSILAVYLLLVAAAVALGVVAWRSWETLVPYAVDDDWITAFDRGVLVVGALWVLVVLSALWMVLRRTRDGGTRALSGVLAVALCVGIAAPATALSRYAGTTNDLIDDVFQPAPSRGGQAAPESDDFSDPVFADGRVNVLLIGGDAGDDRVGLRADTMILASTEVATGRTVLLSLPRNLQRFTFAPGTVMAEQFPDGYTGCGYTGADGGEECLLNSVYTWAADHADLFPGERDPGAAALSSAVAGTLGQPVEYWALVDLRGFREIIDALGGITLRVDRRIPIGGGTSPVSGYIEPGLQELDGYHALWYARSREGSSDYDRVDRQRCVIGAIAREADPVTLLRNYRELARSTEAAVATSVPQNVLADMIKLGNRAKGQPIDSVAFTPPTIESTAYPDLEQIRFLARKAIADSEAAGGRGTGGSGGSGGPAGGSGGSGAGGGAVEEAPAGSDAPSGSDGQAAPGADEEAPAGPVDLSSVCSYS
ncbi:LCP family protein [Vallicoccus soli]|uniref:LytR family transcriptional regulator n=1 Tax=Vallicoccus soli TaxID=2339232 RepID=A0A3A3YXB8_9ACTN|nr:LCP family protein [Vallicoccus soli]RJK95363.1 LytR family transcriptional regulator [Vallicoccus soli]